MSLRISLAKLLVLILPAIAEAGPIICGTRNSGCWKEALYKLCEAVTRLCLDCAFGECPGTRLTASVASKKHRNNGTMNVLTELSRIFSKAVRS